VFGTVRSASSLGVLLDNDGLLEVAAGVLDVAGVTNRGTLHVEPPGVARAAAYKQEATGSLEQVSRVIECAAEGFIVLSGDDFVTLPLLAVGGHGAISVTSNIVPSDVSAMIERFFSDDLEGARSLHYRLQPINRAMFLETNPIPVKTSLAMMGMIEEEFRLPLVRISDENRTRLLEAMKAYGLAVAGR